MPKYSGKMTSQGGSIPVELIRAARREEMLGFEEHKVYHHVTREEAEADATGKFIGVRWVDRNKGTPEKPNARSRLVGQEFAEKGRRDDLFAPTPPLIAARMLVSKCASDGERGRGSRLMLLDVKKAFLYGHIRRNVYIELPDEDPMSKSGELVGKLDKAMYGTRDAPAMWQEHLEGTFKEARFTPSKVAPCVYFHPELHVCAVAHVDDVLFEGRREALDEILKRLRTTYALKAEILGPDKERGEVREGRFLGRTIYWGEFGLTWSGDTKLVDEMLRDWKLEDSNSAITPGTCEDDNTKRDSPMSASEAFSLQRFCS